MALIRELFGLTVDEGVPAGEELAEWPEPELAEVRELRAAARRPPARGPRRR
jgi:hypothetical protein